MRKETTQIDGKKITVYIHEDSMAPIVFSSDVSDSWPSILEECKAMGCPAFHLVSVTGLHWDEELSPWAHEPVVAKDDHFTGDADRYLQVLESEIIPYAKTFLPGKQKQILNGYSMGGLFALYAAHKSTCFDAYSAPSGSIWYPDFVDYVKGHEFARMPKVIYLSLGDRESKTKNGWLSQTESSMQLLKDYYQTKNIITTFELNPGNHFKDVSHRIAKGLHWTLTKLEEKRG